MKAQKKGTKDLKAKSSFLYQFYQKKMIVNA